MPTERIVSVIVPTYNRPGMLGRALESLLTQTYTSIEIIVVDDNLPESPERKETREFMSDFLKHDNIRYLERKENGGGARARNTGIEASRGTYLTFLDDDDEFLPTKIEKQVNLFQKSDIDKLGIVYCRTDYVDGSGNPLYQTCPCVRGDALEYHLKETLGSTGSFLFSKKAVLDAGMFEDIPASQEYVLLYKILKKGYRTDYIDEPLFRMYLHDSDRITTGRRKIEGKLTAFGMIEEDVNNLLNSEDRKFVFYDHYYDLFFLYLKEKNRKQWRSFLLKAVKTDPFNKRNLMMLLALITGYDRFVSIKLKTKKAVNRK